MNKTTLILLLLGLFTISSCIKDNEDNRVINCVNVGDTVPRFSVSDGKGNTFTSDQFTGKRSLLVFFHTECGDCQRELPLVDSVCRALSAEEDYLVIAIAREESPEEVETYWQENGFSIPIYIDGDRSVYSLFANMTIPRLYAINEQGQVTWMAIERTDLTAAELTAIIREQ